MSGDLLEALDRAEAVMDLSARDWGESRDLAVLYAIFCGWEDGPDDEDSAFPELVERFGWSVEYVARLRRLHAAVRAVKETRE